MGFNWPLKKGEIGQQKRKYQYTWKHINKPKYKKTRLTRTEAPTGHAQICSGIKHQLCLANIE